MTPQSSTEITNRTFGARAGSALSSGVALVGGALAGGALAGGAWVGVALVGVALVGVATISPSEARADAAEADTRIAEARKKAAALYPPCTKKASDADLKGAKGSHTAAKQFLERGLYEKAIQSWNDAYTFDCSRPSVFYNLSNAYERFGDKAMTIAVIEIAIERDPDADKATLASKVDNLKSTLAQEPKGGTPEGGDGKPGDGKPGDGKPGDGGKGGDGKGGDGKPGPDRGTERPFGVAPWVTLGVGGAALVAGVPVMIIGRGKVSDAEKTCPTHKLCTNATRDLGNSGNTMTGVGIGLLAGGGAIAIGSLVWQLAGNKPRPKDTARAGLHLEVVPSLAPSMTGAWLTGSF